MPTIYTFGHSVLDYAAARAVLVGAEPITVLIDVRSHPGSTKHPQWNRGAIERAVRRRPNSLGLLPAMGEDARYEWWPELGGWTDQDACCREVVRPMAAVGVDVGAYGHRAFPKQRIAADRVGNAAKGSTPTWDNQGLYDYAWYTAKPEFLAAGQRLIRLACKVNVAIMCAEVLWWKCHRSMVADWLTTRDAPVVHLQPRLTLHEKALGNRLQRYPAAVRRQWRRKVPLTLREVVARAGA